MQTITDSADRTWDHERPWANTGTSWMADRDRYGRTTRTLYATHRGRWQVVAVLVTMPKAWVESHGDDRFMVSDWRDEVADSRPEPRYFRSRPAAVAYAESLVRPLTAAEVEVIDAYASATAGATDEQVVRWAQFHSEAMRELYGTDLGAIHAVLHGVCRRELNRRTN